MAETRFNPIIYVRGYSMTMGEIDETTADPFCGFNIGSTVYRAVADRQKPPRKFIFESPVVRLGTDYGYKDVFEDGYDILDPEWEQDEHNKITNKSIIIYRYYDSASRLLGNAVRPDINEFARGLSSLILRVRDLICKDDTSKQDFKCYLVAHSMGGLVCRSFLQNPKNGSDEARKCIDKFFTYATPHNGIDVAGINVPKWFGIADAQTFSRDEMAVYLNLDSEYKNTNKVNLLPQGINKFPSEKVFCMVGTNRSDYEVLAGLVRTFVGHGSDGLVKIENATLSGINNNVETPCAKAFTYRSHSGFFGIVNSEESYQNLTRFLFADVRVDIWLEINDISLPTASTMQVDESKVNALYQVEITVSPKGKLWYLTRRKVEEDSVACFSHQDWLKSPNKIVKEYLSTVFLSNKARVNTRSPALNYQLDLVVKVPDYEVENKLWFDQHFEGSYLFRNTVQLSITPPKNENEQWKVVYDWQNMGCNAPSTPIDPVELRNGIVSIDVPVNSGSKPGVSGCLKFMVSLWNKSNPD